MAAHQFSDALLEGPLRASHRGHSAVMHRSKSTDAIGQEERIASHLWSRDCSHHEQS